MSDELMLKVAALKVMLEFVREEYDKARSEAAAVMQPGDRRQVYSPTDGTYHIAAVSRTKPTPRAVVTDRAALTEWLLKHYPDKVESGTVVSATDREISELVFRHAPHLLKHTQQVRKDVLATLQAEAVKLGVPIGPGGELDIPGIAVEMTDPVVSCRPDPNNALLEVLEMVHNGRMFLDGTRPKELEASE